MIRINLLPVEFRQVEEKKSTFKPQKILLAAFFVSLVISLFQLFFFVRVQGKLNRLNIEMNQFAQSSKESDELNQTINGKLLPQKKFLTSNILSRYLIAEVMNVLSDALPDSLWLSDLSIKREREVVRLEITGYSRITSKEIAIAQIQEYVNSAKSLIEKVLLNNSENQSTQYEVKAVLTTSLKEFSGVEVMQFSTSFKSTAVSKAK